MSDDTRALIDALLDAGRPSDEHLMRLLTPTSTGHARFIIGSLLGDVVWCGFKRDASTHTFTAQVWRDGAEAGADGVGDTPTAALTDAVGVWVGQCDVDELWALVSAARATDNTPCLACGRR